MVYDREERDEEEDKKERKASVKHADRKYTCHQAGVQLVELSALYTERAIIERIPEDVRLENSISTKREKGMLFANEEYASKMIINHRARQQKNQRDMEKDASRHA